MRLLTFMTVSKHNEVSHRAGKKAAQSRLERGVRAVWKAFAVAGKHRRLCLLLVFTVVQCVRGKEADVPSLSEAVRMQL